MSFSLAVSSPVDGATEVALDATISFRFTATGTIAAATVDVYIGGTLAISAGAFQAGFTGTLSGDGTSNIDIVFATHPDFFRYKTDVVVVATSSTPEDIRLSYSFSTALPRLSNLRAKTWCDGKRVDLYFTLPAGVNQIKILRSSRGFCEETTDPATTLYTGAATNLDSSTMDRYVDGTFSSSVYRTTNADLEEGVFYYYTIFLSFSGSPYVYVTGEECKATGLSIHDYYALDGEYVFKLLPPNVRSRDDGTLSKLCRVVQCGVNLLRGQIEALKLFRDPDLMPAGRMEEAENQHGLLLADLWDKGVSEAYTADTIALRRMAASISEVNTRKGSCDGLVVLAEAFCGWTVRCDEQIDPVCGVTRYFQTWDAESYILLGYSPAYGDIDYTTAGKVFFTSSTDVYENENVATTVAPLPLTASGGPQVAFVLDAFGTFSCVESISTYGGSGYQVNLSAGNSPYTPYLRNEMCFSTATTSGGGNLQLDMADLETDYYPWQFPSPDFDPPSLGTNALAGKMVMYKDGTTDVIVSSTATVSGVFECVMLGNAPIYPDQLCIASWYNGTLIDDPSTRQPWSILRLYVGEFSLTYDPLWDVRLRDETYAGPWSLFTAGLGGVYGSSGYSPSPLDIVLWADGVHAATGTSTAVTRNTLTDSSAAWTPGEFVGFYLNPNWNQTKLYRILWNDATSLLVEVSGGGVSTVTTAGLHYVVLSEKEAARYAGLINLVQSYVPEDSRCLVKFE